MRERRISLSIVFFLVAVIMMTITDAESLLGKKECRIQLDRADVYVIPHQLIGYRHVTPQADMVTAINLRSPMTNSPGNVIGQTYVAYQNSGALGRKIALGYPQNEYTHMIWLYQLNPNFSTGYVGYYYQVYNNGTYLYPAGGISVTSQPLCVEGSLGILGDNRAVIASAPDIHESNAVVYLEYQPNFGVFTQHFLTPDPFAEWYVNGMRTVTPATEVHFGTDTVVYVLTAADSSSYEDTAWLYHILYRKAGEGEFDNGRMIESGIGWTHTIVARQNTDSVAMIYTDFLWQDEGHFLDRNLFYRLSTDQGITWGSPVNIPQYTEDSVWRVSYDFSAVWDDNGDLHVVWNDRKRYDSAHFWLYRCRIVHWSTADEWKSIITEAMYNADCYSDFYTMNAGKMSLSLCEGKLYVVWSQYNDYDVLDDCSDGGFANGELYMAASDDNGLTWDTAVNLTNTRTPGCEPGNCESDVFPSMPRYGAEYPDARDSLDIIYINDKDAGLVIMGQGTWTLNNVMHYRIPCRDVVHLPRITLDATEYDYPMMMEPNQSMDTSFTIRNTGNGPLNWYASVNYISGDEHDWLSIVPPSGFVDRFPSNIGTATLSFTSDNLPGDPSIWEAEVIIASTDYPGVVDPDTIHISLIVASDALRPKADTLNTGCRALIVYNTGRMGGNQPGYSLNIPGDCDTVDAYPDAEVYLYDASPVIAYVNDVGDTVAYTSIFEQKFTDPYSFRPLTGFIKTTETDFDLIRYSAVTTDSIFGIDVTYIVPTDGSCFVLVKYSYYLLEGVAEKTGVCLGMIADWDVPSDTLADNGSGSDETRGTVWQYGAEYHADNAGVCNISETDRLGGITLLSAPSRNAWTADNQAHQEPPAYDPKFLYAQMSSMTGIDLYTAGYGQPAFIDLHTGFTFTQADMSPGETFTYLFCLATTNEGVADYLNQVVAAQAWANSHVLSADCLPGDASNDLQINIGDAAYIINYIFKGGPAPMPYEVCSGDPNGDCACNIGDAVYLINYIFKGGPAPVSYLEWYTTCCSPRR